MLGIPMVSRHVSIEVTNSSSAPSGSLGNVGLELRPKPSRSKVCSVRRALSESMLRIQRPTPPPKPCTITSGVRSFCSGLTVTVQILFWFGRDTYRAKNLFWRPEEARMPGEINDCDRKVILPGLLFRFLLTDPNPSQPLSALPFHNTLTTNKDSLLDQM